MGRVLSAILIGGLVAGALDIAYAFFIYGDLSYGMSPIQVLQSVAAGWIGREPAMAGGISTAVLGAITHFGIAIVMAAVFVLAAQLSSSLRKSALLWGALYGLVLYVAMNYVIAPLSAADAAGQLATTSAEASERLTRAFSSLRPSDPDHPWMLAATIFTHVVLVGIPIALIAASFNRGRIDVMDV